MPSATPVWQVRGDDLIAFDRLPVFAEFALARAGLHFELGVHQVLAVGEATLAVSVWRDRRGLYVVGVDDGWDGSGRGVTNRVPESLALAELEAVRHSCHMFIPSPAELPRWKRLLLVDGGYALPTAIEAPVLPETAPGYAKAVLDAAVRLARLRGPDEEFPLAPSFLVRWGPMPKTAPQRGVRWLKRNGYLDFVREADFGFPERAHLWRLADPKGAPE